MNIRLDFKKIKPQKVVRAKSVKSPVSRLCLAKAHFDDDKWKAIINVSLPDTEATYYQIDIISKTLENPKYIFSKEKDKTNHYETVIRNSYNRYVGFNAEKYDVLREGLIIAGYIYLIEGDYQFSYEEFVGYGIGRTMNNVAIKDTPVFHKGYGNRKV